MLQNLHNPYFNRRVSLASKALIKQFKKKNYDKFLEEKFQNMSDEALCGQTLHCKNLMKEGKSLDNVLH